MRNLRGAAVVAAMLGSVGMLGAGVATAQETPAVTCEQDASSTDFDFSQGGTVELLGGGGSADASATQQVCGVGNEGNANTGGTAVGGAGTAALADGGVIEAL
jgi:hypothetical protein